MDITKNTFGDNTTIHQGDVHHHSRNQTSSRCLADLRSTDPRDDKIRIEQTNGGLLKESYEWILKNDNFKRWREDEQSRLLWITGDPGKGKTMMLCGIIDELVQTINLKDPESETLLSYFFCQSTDSRINNATAVLRGLVYLLIDQQRSFVSHVQHKYDVAGKGLFEDANAWAALSQIFVNILQDPSIGNVVLIIDGLDECERDQSKLLNLIIQHSSLPRVKWIVSSRNGLNIEQKLGAHSSQTLLSLESKENEDCVSQAVDAYIERRVSQQHLVQDDQALQDELQKAMRQKVNRTFLWVSLVMKELEHVESWEALQVVDGMPSDLKDVYSRMMKHIQQLKRGNPEFCIQLLSTACTAYRPLRLAELGFLSGLPGAISEKPGYLRRIVTMCGSFLTIRDENVYFIHQSAKEYLSTEALKTIFPNGTERVHHSLFSRSLQGMYKTLRRDVYGLDAPGFPIDKVMQPDPDPLATTRYSCVYWANHLRDGISVQALTPIDDLDDNGTVYQFLSTKYLYWLEALSLLHSMSDGVLALHTLQALVLKIETKAKSQLMELIRDACRFILAYASVVEIAPLQVVIHEVRG